MFAVIKTGGKQYRVAPNDTVVVEKLAGEPGAKLELTDVLMIGGGEITVDAGALAKAAVSAEVGDQTRADKIIVFKKKRRQNYRRRHGHRQEQTVLRITAISPDGKPATAIKAEAAPKKKAAPKRAPAAIAETEE